MPYLSDAELEAQLNRVERKDSELAQYKERDGSFGLGVMPVMGGMGMAAAVGFVRSKFEDPNTGEWNVPGTRWDAEAVAFLALAGLAFFGHHVGMADYRGYAALGAIGVGSHYAGEIGRRYGRTGKLDFHVGGGNGGVPPWDPSSFDPTQFTAPYDDEAARGLASSGV